MACSQALPSAIGRQNLLVEPRRFGANRRVRGNRAERTRTACQARSRYRTGLSRVIRRGNSAIKCRRSRATTLSRKDWHAGAIGAVLSVNFGRPKGAPRSCPAGCIAEVGLWWCGATPRNRTEDLDVKACKEATDGVSASRRSNDKIIAVLAILSRRGPIAARSNRASSPCCNHPQAQRSKR